MSSVNTSNKGKRRRSPSSNESNNTFVETVKSRVSGLLPTTITKWFSSPSSSSANGSAPPMEATDSSTDDEGIDSQVVTHPPQKRMRYSANVSPNNYKNNFCVSDNGKQICETSKSTEPSNTFSVIQSPPAKTQVRRETGFSSTPLRPADDKSTLVGDRNDEKSYFSSQAISTQIGGPQEKKRKSLFNNESFSTREILEKPGILKSMNSEKDPKQPSFKASLLGSPFYAGRTMYGGAASSLYVNQPNVKQTKVAVVNDSNKAVNIMSQAARNILDLLEHYSSPLNEVKRIPHYKRAKNNSTQTNDFNSTKSYKTQELYVPSVASILRVKQRSKLMDSTAAARQTIASHSSQASFSPYPSQPQKNTVKEQSKLTTKVTSRLTRTRGDVNKLDSEKITPIELPKCSLQINKDNMPKFSFATSVVTHTAPNTSKTDVSSELAKYSEKTGKTSSLSEIRQDNNEIAEKVKKEGNNSNNFKFSSPIRVSKEDHQLSLIQPNFVFGVPDFNISDKSITESIELQNKNTKLSACKAIDWKCADCWVSNASDAEKCVCCGGKKTSETTSSSKCTICKTLTKQKNSEKCINCEKISNPISGDQPALISITADTATSNWKCKDCWVNNDASAEKCVCCGSKNENTNTSKAKKQDNEKTWKCDTCWIANQSSVDKCAACGASRTGADASTKNENTAQSTPNSSYKEVLSSQSDKWECSSCLLKNDSHQTECVCCRLKKPVNDNKTQHKTTFNFGVPKTNFKFGIVPDIKQNTENAASKIEVTVNKTESEKNNNNLSSTPNFTFGIPEKKLDSVTLPGTETNSTPKFNFSLPSNKPESQIVTKKASAFSSVTEPAKGANEINIGKQSFVKEAEQEVPTLENTNNPLTNNTPVVFGSVKLISENTSVGNPLATDTKIQTEKKNTDSSENKVNSISGFKNSFTFSAGSGTTNLFTSPNQNENKSNTPLLSFTPIKSDAASTIKNNTLFTTSDSSKSSDVLFPKNDVKLTPAETTPVFGFGTNQTSLNTASETKPKFNFTFGASKSETPKAFGTPTSFSAASGTPAQNSLQTTTEPSSANPLLNGTVLSDSEVNKGNMFSNISKETAWTAPAQKTNSTNMFSANPSTNTLQESKFTFGASTKLPAVNLNTTPAFGSPQTNRTLPSFGSSSATSPTFGNSQPSNNAIPNFNSNTQVNSAVTAFGANQQNTSGLPSFGNNQQNSSLPTVFGQHNQTSSSSFGVNQQSSISASPFGHTQQNTLASPFGSNQQSITSPFGNSGASTFGAGVQTSTNTTPAPAMVFGSNQSTSNVFGLSNQSTFSSPVQNQAAPMFGNPLQASQPTMSLFGSSAGAGAPAFGTPTAAAAPAFSAPAASIPSFEAPAPNSAPTFNFGSQQTQNNGVFGFGQQQQQQQFGGYTFGAAPGAAAPQVQFAMGISTGSTASPQTIAGRKMRKPIRKATQR